MASAGTLIFELAADVSHLRADMAKAQDTITASLDSIANSTAATALISGAQFAFNFAKGFADTIKGAIDAADALNDLSQKIGASTEEISALGYAAKLSGSDLDAVTTGLKGLSKSLTEAKNPATEAGKALASIGLSAKQLQGQNPTQAFTTIAQAMSQFKDGADKSAVAMALFGKSGTTLIPLLDQGAEGIAALNKEAADLGAIVSTETAQAMGDLNDNFDRLKEASAGAALKFAEQMQPALKEVTRLMIEMKTKGTDMNEGMEAIAQTAKTLIAALIGLGGTIASLATVAGGFAKLASTLTTPGGMNEGLEAMSDAWKKAQNIMYNTVNSMDTVTHKMTDQEKATAAAAAAARAAAAANEDANKKQLDFSPSAAAAKKAKKEVDEYAKAMDELNKKMVALVTNGNPMAEMLADPKFKKFSDAQQESLKELMNDYLDLKAATDQEVQAQKDVDAANQKGVEDQNAYTKAMQDTTSAALDSLDPMRVQSREMALYGDALERNIINQDQFNALVVASEKKFTDAVHGITPMTEQTKALTDAINGFGKQSADAFVEFASGADTLGNSFRKLIASMLKEMASMIAYQYVFKGIFSAVSTFAGGTPVASGVPGWTPSSVSSAPMLATSNAVLGRAAPMASSGGGSTASGNQGGGSNTPNVQVNVHVNKEQDQTKDTTADDAKQATALGNRIATVVRAVITQEKRSGGILAPAR